ncbi:multidrug efflux SMR transporter [Paenibacillus sp. UMB4589-SE434]|uniref:DMT family transporter n=1 Tax=Paenibacillus sp. UMB4589-SE434 TaxID=3046314 RepID=UPI00254AA8B2|nr:multidrug efflux SMR transporter [Paenibacillus sp. UMB4589-SE434]MDK8182905.1 multidrug efflux SMR transporter [Paenibacillus sp. UMB4589-SE434]
MQGYIFLAVAIVTEVFGSTMLKYSNGFSRLWPSLGVVAGYGTAFYMLGLTLKTLPLGTAYAIWAGIGTALTAIIGYFLFKDQLSTLQGVGILLVIGGVVLLNFAK